jgi:hypothetical protein
MRARRAEERSPFAKGVAELGVVAVQENVGSERHTFLRERRAASLTAHRHSEDQHHGTDDDPHAPYDTPRLRVPSCVASGAARQTPAAPPDPFARGSWHFEVEAQAGFELWNYNSRTRISSA